MLLIHEARSDELEDAEQEREPAPRVEVLPDEAGLVEEVALAERDEAPDDAEDAPEDERGGGARGRAYDGSDVGGPTIESLLGCG